MPKLKLIEPKPRTLASPGVPEDVPLTVVFNGRQERRIKQGNQVWDVDPGGSALSLCRSEPHEYTLIEDPAPLTFGELPVGAEWWKNGRRYIKVNSSDAWGPATGTTQFVAPDYPILGPAWEVVRENDTVYEDAYAQAQDIIAGLDE